MPKKKPAPKKPLKRMGRKPSVFTDVDIANLETAIQNGNSIKASCELLGLDERMFYYWIERASMDNPDPVYVEFASRMKKARGLSKASILKEIKGHGAKDWRALAWILERQFPDEFGQKETVDVKHRGKVAHDHQHKTIHLHLPVEIATPRNITPPAAPQIKATSTPKAS